MRRWRLALFALLIALPSLLIVGTGAWFVVREIPRAIRNEPGRIGREYREVAEELMRHPERKTYEGERRRGWTQNGRINGIAWGYAVAAGQAHVWHALPDRRCRAVSLPAIRPFPYAAVFYLGGTAVAVTLLGLTALSLLYFFRFVRERDDFLAATAHDLTTPLVGLRLTIGRNDAEARRLNERMLLLVGNIKEFLRRGGRRVPPACRPVDIVALCREAYGLFAADYADAESGPVAFDFPPSPAAGPGAAVPLLALADETMTLQILWNLFGNDLKYAAPYGKVQVRISADAERVCVAFADEGQGMTAGQRRQAFDRYYRARTVLQSGKGGFGIGLCTAREFARAMGGDLTVEANAPKGCVFTLSLRRFRAVGG
ncbi:MAG: sensor histidine kinase [Kiritimatiellia bacterium]